MSVGIFGLPQAGKTTIFNAATRGAAAGGRSGRAGPNLGVVKVPDARLGVLAEMDHPKRIVHAEIEYLDVPAPAGGEGPKGISAEYLNVLGGCEALLMVCRAFRDPAVAHVQASVDPYRDAASLGLELLLTDIGVLERREARIETQLRSAKAIDRDALHREQTLLASIRAQLEDEVPVRAQKLPKEAGPLLQNFSLLSAKPLMIVFNIDEDDVGRTPEIEAEMAERLGSPAVALAAVSGKLETELAEMSPEDEAEFRVSLGAGEPGLDRTAVLCYGVLGLIAFLTTGPDETRAWAIRDGATALEAAGKIHTDIQRGFIRAEIVGYDDLVRAGGLPEARKQATLRSEGKGYVMRDGDVVNFLFNV
ncbi:MAG: redox-regulated ATPase YchF [Chloroflexi bacterium]|nr:redox-regulated ATPase YchF [Chloroflexota bacterium]MCH7655488.1 redox-regulated ATPase YchF [Chloroflexota bacterium]